MLGCVLNNWLTILSLLTAIITALIYYCTLKEQRKQNDLLHQQEAFGLIYERYFKGTSTYFTHICYMLRFLERNKDIYSSLINECAQTLKDNMSAYELGILSQYADYDKSKNGVLIKEYLS